MVYSHSTSSVVRKPCPALASARYLPSKHQETEILFVAQLVLNRTVSRSPYNAHFKTHFQCRLTSPIVGFTPTLATPGALLSPPPDMFTAYAGAAIGCGAARCYVGASSCRPSFCPANAPGLSKLSRPRCQIRVGHQPECALLTRSPPCSGRGGGDSIQILRPARGHNPDLLRRLPERKSSPKARYCTPSPRQHLFDNPGFTAAGTR